MGKGPGQTQLRVLTLLLESGGALAVGGILAGLDKASIEAGTREYHGIRSSLSRTLKALRDRGLVMTYTGVSVAGRAVVVAALTSEGAVKARGIEWEEEES